jgi:hypothetical protein
VEQGVTVGAPPSEQLSWSSGLYVAFPIALLTSVAAAAAVGGETANFVLNAETGAMETLTGGMALASCAISLAAAARADSWQFRAWLLLFAAAMLFFGGEDLNWGQYYFGWDAPEYFRELNNENETNLHNMTWWANQFPRMVVEAWLVVACILVPLGWQWPRTVTSALVPSAMWPDGRLVFVAMLALLLKLPKLFSDAGLISSEAIGGVRTSEVQEMMIACTFILYAVLLRGRVSGSRR